jgi:hypothetical protein
MMISKADFSERCWEKLCPKPGRVHQLSVFRLTKVQRRCGDLSCQVSRAKLTDKTAPPEVNEFVLGE